MNAEAGALYDCESVHELPAADRDFACSTCFFRLDSITPPPEKSFDCLRAGRECGAEVIAAGAPGCRRYLCFASRVGGEAKPAASRRSGSAGFGALLPLNGRGSSETVAESIRSLAETRVLRGAGIAAALTTLAACARLTRWPAPPGSLAFVLLLFLWVAFMLWSFVLGWHEKYSGQPPLAQPRERRWWTIGAAWAIALSLWLCLAVDPQLRQLRPEEYPVDAISWLANSLFTVAFDPLFLCFAPYAFFIRLSRRPAVAYGLTVAFAVFVQFLKLDSAPKLTVPWLATALIFQTAIASSVTVYFYRRGGAWLVWFISGLVQLRLLPALLR